MDITVFHPGICPLCDQTHGMAICTYWSTHIALLQRDPTFTPEQIEAHAQSVWDGLLAEREENGRALVQATDLYRANRGIN